MSFPADLTNAIDGITEIVAAHLNNLEAKVGTNNSAVPTSLDYLLKNVATIEPGHKHSKLWAADGSPEAVTVDAAGNVGIGTTSPEQLLHVVNPNDWGRIRLAEGGRQPVEIVGAGNSTGADLYLFNTDASGNLQNRVSLNYLGNVGISTTSFGAGAAKVLGMAAGTAATTALADMAQMWVEDINGAAGKAGLHAMYEIGLKLVIPGLYLKTDTGDPAAYFEGMLVANTVDNTLKMYADGGFRQLATW